ncbi:serpin family protein [Bacillus sp. JCM 19041]|uniref:serpin family protein n=1 Tax=Bacillus sp. JCM 19041 TaxID=1460637 RepID=UPI0006D0EB17
MGHSRKLIVFGISFLMMVGCGTEDGTGGNKRINQAVSQEVEQISTAQNTFASTLLNELWKENNEQNMLVSPYSVYQALAMLYAEADGKTKEELAELLELQPNDEIGPALKQQLDYLHETDIELQVANSVWYGNGAVLVDDYIAEMESLFDADVSDDFTPEAINFWVNEKTKGRIPSIVEEMNGDTIAFLINTVFYDAKWREPFTETPNQPFYLTENKSIEVPFMELETTMPYVKTAEVEAVKIAYEDPRFSLLVALPNGPVIDLGESFMHISELSFNEKAVDVKLPLFTLEQKHNLGQVLSTMGMASLFENASLNQMFEVIPGAYTYIDEVIQKAMIEVDAEGTVAAAATAVEIVLESSIEMDNHTRFVADRPFIYAILDEETNTLLFAGVMMDPSEQGDFE